MPRFISMEKNWLLRLVSFSLLCLLFLGIVQSTTYEDFENVENFTAKECSSLSLSSTTGVIEGSYALNVSVTSCSEATPGARSNTSYFVVSNSTIAVSVYFETSAFCDGDFYVAFEDGGNSYSCTYSAPVSNGQNYLSWLPTEFIGGDSFNCDLFDWNDTAFIDYYCSLGEVGQGAHNFYIDELNIDTCSIPRTTNDWVILGGDNCLLGTNETIAGDLNISDGALQIQEGGGLNISGGDIFIYPGCNLTMDVGGEIYGG